MKCYNCKSKDIIRDEISNTYYCKKCNTIMSVDEVIRDKVRLGRTKDSGHMNGFSLFWIHLMMCIPIVNVLVVYMVNHSTVKEEYSRSFSYRLLGQIFILISTVFIYLSWLQGKVDINEEYTLKYIKEANTLLDGTDVKVNVDNIPVSSTIRDIISKYNIEVKQEVYSNFDNYGWILDDTIIVNGEQVHKLIDSLRLKDVSVLLQNNSIISRYNENCYFILGNDIEGSVAEDGARVYKGTILELRENFKMLRGFYCLSLDSMFDSSKIQYVSPEYFYEVQFILDGEIIVGIVLTETNRR